MTSRRTPLTTTVPKLPQALGELLQPWNSAPGKPVAGVAKKKNQKELNAQMWEAIQNGSHKGLEVALQKGAHPDSPLNHTHPLWVVVQNGRYDLAEMLLAKGATPTLLSRAQSLWAALADRNDPAEGERLVALLQGVHVTPKSGEFFKHKAYDLFLWWHEKFPNHLFRPSSHGTKDETATLYREYMVAACRGPDGMVPLFNRAWGIDPTNPYGLIERTSAGLAVALWEEVARRDNVALAQHLLRHGWGPLRPTDLHPQLRNTRQNKATALETSTAWLFMSYNARNLFEWWMSKPLLAQEAMEQLTAFPEDILFTIAHDQSKLKWLHGLGVDFGVTGRNGDRLLHHLARSKNLTKAVIHWWLEHRADDFKVVNAAGFRPLEQPLGPDDTASPAMRAYAKQKWLEYQMPQGVSATGRARL